MVLGLGLGLGSRVRVRVRVRVKVRFRAVQKWPVTVVEGMPVGVKCQYVCHYVSYDTKICSNCSLKVLKRYLKFGEQWNCRY